MINALTADGLQGSYVIGEILKLIWGNELTRELVNGELAFATAQLLWSHPSASPRNKASVITYLVKVNIILSIIQKQNNGV